MLAISKDEVKARTGREAHEILDELITKYLIKQRRLFEYHVNGKEISPAGRLFIVDGHRSSDPAEDYLIKALWHTRLNEWYDLEIGFLMNGDSLQVKSYVSVRGLLDEEELRKIDDQAFEFFRFIVREINNYRIGVMQDE